MANYTYIKHSQRKIYVTFPNQFDEASYNNIGTTWQDYLDDKWVLLSPEQVAFHEEYPNASVKEVWDMQLTAPHVRTLEEAKTEMINRITEYDNSDEVNSFIVSFPSDSEDAVNGYAEIKAWLTQQERSNYRSSIDSAKLLGVETLGLYIGDLPLTLPTALAEQMLSQIQLYADACFIVTKQHKAVVNQMLTIQEVDSYAYRVGYPEVLTFTLPSISSEE